MNTELDTSVRENLITSKPARREYRCYGDQSNLIEETNGTGTVVARYQQGENIDEPLTMLRSGTTSYYHSDGVGSVTSLSNTAGSLAQTYTFDSFGKTNRIFRLTRKSVSVHEPETDNDGGGIPSWSRQPLSQS